MEGFNVIKNWKLGDQRQLTEKQIHQLQIDGALNSYDQVYEIEGKKWKVKNKVAFPNMTMFTLECVEE